MSNTHPALDFYYDEIKRQCTRYAEGRERGWSPCLDPVEPLLKALDRLLFPEHMASCGDGHFHQHANILREVIRLKELENGVVLDRSWWVKSDAEQLANPLVVTPEMLR